MGWRPDPQHQGFCSTDCLLIVHSICVLEHNLWCYQQPQLTSANSFPAFPCLGNKQRRYGRPSSAEDQSITERAKSSFKKWEKSFKQMILPLQQSRKQTMNSLHQVLICLAWIWHLRRMLLHGYYSDKAKHKHFPSSSWKAFHRLALLEKGKNSWQLHGHLSTPVTDWPR